MLRRRNKPVTKGLYGVIAGVSEWVISCLRTYGARALFVLFFETLSEPGGHLFCAPANKVHGGQQNVPTFLRGLVG